MALAGTTAEIVFDAVTVKFAAARLNRALLALVKLAPVMTTLLPTIPFVGEKPVSRGGT